MLKVVMLGPYPTDEQFTRGGVQKVVHNLVEGFKGREDIELHIVALSDVTEDRVLQSGNTQVHYLKRQKRFCLPTFNIYNILKARREIKRIAPDLIHCQQSGVESFIASGLGIPTIVTLHAVIHREAKVYPGLRSRLSYAQTDWLSKVSFRQISHYIPSSPYVLQEVSLPAGSRWVVIENPVEEAFFAVQNREVADRLLFAGTISPRKGVTDLIQAIRIIKEKGIPVTLHLAGAVRSQEYYDRALQLIQESALQETVRFLGLVPEGDLLREFSEAVVIVLPSYEETAPLTIQQAMAAGKPVVASKVGGIPYLVEDGVNGYLVEAGDVAGLADKLVDLLNNDDKRREMGASARQKAIERFQIAKTISKTVEIYHQVIKEGY